MSSNIFYKKIAGYIPGLNVKLLQAGMLDTEVQFIKKTLFSAFYMSIAVLVAAGFVFAKKGSGVLLLIFAGPIVFFLFFTYFLKIPDVKSLKIEKDINREIVYAGRFLMIELQSGVALYNSFKHVAHNYPIIGTYFMKIIHDVDMGTPIDDALGNAIELTPSHNFRKLLWQVMNSMTTGADIATSLTSVIEQIVKEQEIELKEYGRKLNPLAMFYMIIAVIFPSIGVTMLVILVSFLSIKLSLGVFLLIACLMGFVQFLFYTIVKSSRPAGQFE